MTPDQGVFLRQLHVRSIAHEHSVTRRVIEAIPDAKAEYRPEPFVKSAFELAWHIVSAEHRFCEAVVNGKFEFGGARPEQVKSVADIASWYDEAWADDERRLAAMTPDALVQPVDFRGLLQLPAIAYLQTALAHSIHHRGQLTMYLRPMGAKVPAIYGESYDTAQAKQSAQSR